MQRERPRAEDVDPDAMAVDATPDEVRNHGDQDETETAQVSDGSVAPVDAVQDDDASVNGDESE